MKSLGKNIFFLGGRLHIEELNAMHIGFVLSMFNLLLIDLVLLIAWFVPIQATGTLLLFITPLVFVLFWLWMAQSVLYAHHRVSLHDAVIIAKWSIWPFLVMMLLTGSVYVLSTNTVGGGELAAWSMLTFLSSVGLLLAGFGVITFSLRHPFKTSH